MRKWLFALGLFVMAVGPLFAQTDQMNMAARNMTGKSVNYYYAKPGDITITVSLWGFVQKPGLYEVASSTNLIELLSLAGGPGTYADLDDVQIIRSYKDKNGKTYKKELTINLKKMLSLSEEQIRLQPGDVIYVNHTNWYTIKEAFSLTSSVALLFSAMYYLTRIF
ncbi:polysaccharide biosynthesis/export family protein [Caldithrix abyssi]|uniref:SLBB domain-containing protein n=1 Tax=Caldithrix abyssi DSM 13497 TaxID=880073 RepID=H1XPL6_CALAY|nr:SLBB domain-containing protein [Caldithrix abyssi]APF19841.1 SLBB domain-containing protein [Caldithrix abyssi DSM 13497]EHO39937.1 Soluble ligand binding domain-containing protein [Caldithrix abyssi DSM 13497]